MARKYSWEYTGYLRECGEFDSEPVTYRDFVKKLKEKKKEADAIQAEELRRQVESFTREMRYREESRALAAELENKPEVLDWIERHHALQKKYGLPSIVDITG